MTKKVEVNEALDWIRDDVYDTLMGLWMKHCQNFNFKSAEDYEAYGDTYVGTGSYITDESEEKCREEFEKEVDADALIDELKTNPSFKDSLKQLIESWAWEKQLEV